MKILTKTFFFNIPPPQKKKNVAILHLFVYCGTHIDIFSDKELDLKNFIFPPNIESMFSLKGGGGGGALFLKKNKKKIFFSPQNKNFFFP